MAINAPVAESVMSADSLESEHLDPTEDDEDDDVISLSAAQQLANKTAALLEELHQSPPPPTSPAPAAAAAAAAAGGVASSGDVGESVYGAKEDCFESDSEDASGKSVAGHSIRGVNNNAALAPALAPTPAALLEADDATAHTAEGTVSAAQKLASKTAELLDDITDVDGTTDADTGADDDPDDADGICHSKDVDPSVIFPHMASKCAEFTVQLKYRGGETHISDDSNGYGLAVASAGASAGGAVGEVVVSAVTDPLASYPPKVGDVVLAVDDVEMETPEDVHTAFEEVQEGPVAGRLSRKFPVPAAAATLVLPATHPTAVVVDNSLSPSIMPAAAAVGVGAARLAGSPNTTTMLQTPSMPATTRSSFVPPSRAAIATTIQPSARETIARSAEQLVVNLLHEEVRDRLVTERVVTGAVPRGAIPPLRHEDEFTLASIEASFQNLHAYLDRLSQL
jgi:hypothetical protein